MSPRVLVIRRKVTPLVKFIQLQWERYIMVETHLVPFLLFMSLGLLALGVVIPSVSVEIGGLSGWLLKNQTEPMSVNTLSVIGLGAVLPGSSIINDHGNKERVPMGIYFIEATFFVFAMCASFLMLSTLALIWLRPLSKSRWMTIQACVHTLEAWNAIDVFVVAVFAGVAEIGQLTHFIIGDKCDQLNVLLEQLFADQFEPKCLIVNSNFIDGSWMLLATAVIACLVARRVIFLANNAAHATVTTTKDEKKEDKDTIMRWMKERTAGGTSGGCTVMPSSLSSSLYPSAPVMNSSSDILHGPSCGMSDTHNPPGRAYLLSTNNNHPLVNWEPCQESTSTAGDYRTAATAAVVTEDRHVTFAPSVEGSETQREGRTKDGTSFTAPACVIAPEENGDAVCAENSAVTPELGQQPRTYSGFDLGLDHRLITISSNITTKPPDLDHY